MVPVKIGRPLKFLQDDLVACCLRLQGTDQIQLNSPRVVRVVG